MGQVALLVKTIASQGLDVLDSAWQSSVGLNPASRFTARAAAAFRGNFLLQTHRLLQQPLPVASGLSPGSLGLLVSCQQPLQLFCSIPCTCCTAAAAAAACTDPCRSCRCCDAAVHGGKALGQPTACLSSCLARIQAPLELQQRRRDAGMRLLLAALLPSSEHTR